jgi:hypothetical protein
MNRTKRLVLAAALFAVLLSAANFFATQPAMAARGEEIESGVCQWTSCGCCADGGKLMCPLPGNSPSCGGFYCDLYPECDEL